MRKFQFEGKGNVSGDRVRELRLRARLSQTALAAKMQTEGAILNLVIAILLLIEKLTE